MRYLKFVSVIALLGQNLLADAPTGTVKIEQPAVPIKPTEKLLEPAAALKYERENFYGEPVMVDGKLSLVKENKSQKHSKEQHVLIKVSGFKPRKKEPGRIRVVVWNSQENYGQEGKVPFRASSHWAKDVVDGVMTFEIGGLEVGREYSFFAHFDKNNDGIVNRVFGIPTEPYVFSNKNNPKEGLKREGLSPPKFENTLVKYTGPGQIIEMKF